VLIVAPSEAVAERIRRALDQGQLLPSSAQAAVVTGTNRDELVAAAAQASCIFVWPGTARWVSQELKGSECLMPVHALSDSTITRVRQAVLDAAIRQVAESGAFGTVSLNSTSGDGARAKTAVADA
jgi:hypothetical protein